MNIEALKGDEDVQAVLLFGSKARGDSTEKSDIDICILLRSGIDRKQVFEKELKFKAREDLDISIFQNLPLKIRKEVLKEGKVLFCRNEDYLYDVAFETIKAYDDFKKYYEDYVGAIA